MFDTVSIVSCDRVPSYIEDTITTIPENFDIEIFYQGDSSKFKPSRGSVIEVDKISDSVSWNAQFNYATTLLNSKDKFIIEDDIIFSKRFNEFASVLFPVINDYNNAEHIKSFAVSFYSCYNWPSVGAVNIIDYPLNSFYGTQALIYSEYFAKNFGQFILDHIGNEPYDLAMKSWMSSDFIGNRLFTTSSSLVQHIGMQTTGLGNGHQCPNFVDD
jgi:hypothetical protein